MSSIDHERLVSMNSRMLQISKDSLKKQLVENSDEVILLFGGLENMISLCLTNPNAHKHLDQINLEAFDNKILMNMTNHNEVPDFDMRSTELADNNNNNNNYVRKDTNNINGYESNCVALVNVETLKEYKDACIVINADPCDNLYHKIFSKSNKNINLIKIDEKIRNNTGIGRTRIF